MSSRLAPPSLSMSGFSAMASTTAGETYFPNALLMKRLSAPSTFTVVGFSTTILMPCGTA